MELSGLVSGISSKDWYGCWFLKVSGVLHMYGMFSFGLRASVRAGNGGCKVVSFGRFDGGSYVGAVGEVSALLMVGRVRLVWSGGAGV